MKTDTHNYIRTPCTLSARAAHLIGGMSGTPLTCYSLGSYVQSLIRAEQQRRVLKTDTHNYIGTPCTLSARAAHLIGGMSDTPLSCYSLGSYVQSPIRAEKQRRVLKTDTHNYIGTPCTLSARAAHLIGGMSGTPLTCYSLGSYVQSLIRAEQQRRVLKTDTHNYIGTPCTLSAREAHLIGGMSGTPLTCYSLGSYVQSLIRAEQQRRVLKTDTHNYIGTPCTLSARAAHLIGGMSDTPLSCYSLGSYVQSPIRAEKQRRVLKTDTHNYIGTPCTLSARAAHLIGGMSGTPLTCYSLGSYVQSLIRAEQQRRVLKTDTHNYIGTPCTLSAREAHLIGGMSGTPLTCYSLGSYVQSLIRAEQQRRVLKTDTHNYIGTPCTLSARAAHLIGGMSGTPLSCYSLGSYVQSPIRAEQQRRVLKTDTHNYIGTPCTLSARAAHLIGGMSGTPLTCYSLGSYVQSLIRAEQQRRVLKTDTHNYIGTPCTLSAREAHLIGGMSDTPLSCYSLGSYDQSPIRAE